MIHLTTRTLLGLVLSLGTLAPTAAAGDWGISFGQRGRRSGVSVQVGSHTRGPSYGRVHRHGRSCRLEPAHYETVQDRVWVEGYSEKIWISDEYEITCDLYGNQFRRLIRRGHYDVVQHQGHYEVRSRQVYVPARQICSQRSYERYRQSGRHH
jgi:hypothetical protein